MTRKRLPFWVAGIGLAVIVLCHTQVTLRQLALRVTGVREGEITRLVPLDDYFVDEDRFDRRRLTLPSDLDPNTVVILHDAHASFLPGELSGGALYFTWGRLPILDNTARHLLVSCDSLFEVEARLKDSDNYHTGGAEPGLFPQAALALPRVNVTLGDVATILFAACMALFWWRAKEGARPDSMVWAVVAFLLISGVSLVKGLRPFDSSMHSPNMARGLLEWGQLVGILLVAYLSFSVAFRTMDRRRSLVGLICIMAGVVCVVGLVEYWAVFSGRTLRGLLDVEAIDGPFGIRYNAPRAWSVGSESNRTVLALYLAIAFPFLIASVRAGSTVWRRVSAGIVAIMASVLILHLPLLVITFIGGLWVVLAGKTRWTLGYAASFALVLGTVCTLNPNHGKALLDSVAVHRTRDPFGLQPMPSKGGSFEGERAWQQKLVERQAAMNAMGYSPVLGVGLGNYQAAINDFYSNAKVEGHELEKSPLNLMERNSHALFQVIGVETGALGIMALMVVLMAFVGRGIRTQMESNGADGAYQTAVAAACGVLALSAFQTSFLIRGIGIIAAAIFAATGMPTEEPGDKELDLREEDAAQVSPDESAS